MKFELPPMPINTAQALRDAARARGPMAVDVRALLERAATELEDWRKLALNAADQLDEANNLRVGVQDSQSRVEEVQRQTKRVMKSLAEQFRGLS